MIESPLLQELKQEWETERARKDLVKFLRGRFGEIPSDLIGVVQRIADGTRLESLIEWAGECGDLDAFQQRLTEQNK